MPPALALFLTLGFVGFFLRRDLREKTNVTGALWLPVIWMLLSGSRPVSQWLRILGLNVTGAITVEEGSPLDACVFFVLIASGFYVLRSRQVSLSKIIRNNGWITLFILYCFVTILWSDFPFVSFKRWIKILGHPIMVLVLFTEPDPEEAVTRLVKRCAYVLVPVSIMFIKYFPEFGRSFSPWSGEASNCGVAGNKNELGYLCLVFGLFFVWFLMKTIRAERSRGRLGELAVLGGFLFLIGWLILKAHSATSALSLMLGVFMLVVLGWPVVRRQMNGAYVLVAILALGAAEMTFDIFGDLAELTGHSSTIAGRAELWRELVQTDTNPVLGAGFESFWLGDRLAKLWEEHWWHPTEAHNGYLETYLNLGGVGLFILLGLIVATFRKSRLALSTNPDWGRFRMAFLAAMVAYNFTEAAFKGVSFMLFVFYIIALEYPKVKVRSGGTSLEPGETEGETPEPAKAPVRRPALVH